MKKTTNGSHVNIISFRVNVSALTYTEEINLQKFRPPNRVGQGFWVYGIQGLFKSGIRYIAA